MKYLAFYFNQINEEKIAYGLLKKAADFGDAEACYSLSKWTDSGTGCNKDKSLGWEYVRAAALAGHQIAQNDIRSADELLKQLYIRKDDPAAYFQIAEFYEIGIGSTRKDLSQYLLFLGLAAKHKHPEANYALGVYYENASGPQRDKAYQFLKSAADLGHVTAQQKCAGYERHFALTKQRADDGDVGALVVLAGLYAQGIGTEKNNSECMRCLYIAAQAHYVPALLALGFRFAHGVGIFRDVKQAAKYFIEALQRNRKEAFPLVNALLEEWNREILQLQQDETDEDAQFVLQQLFQARDQLMQALGNDDMSF